MLPWICVDVATPEDARPYYPDGGLEAERATLEAEIAVWWDEGCDWVTVEDWPLTTRECTTEAGVYQYEGIEDNQWDSVRSTTHVRLPDGASTWTAITLGSYEYGYDAGWDSSWEAGVELTAEWTGEIEGLPTNGFYVYTQHSYDELRDSWWHSVTTPECSWDAYDYTDMHYAFVRLTAVGHEVEARMDYCWGEGWSAELDGVYLGGVDATTWALDDGDLDGRTPSAGDCDDADPTVNPCAEDVPYDGIDQDCHEGDLTDVDDDGADATVAGGDDCDDDDASIHPDAADTAGDGIDQDCDGTDDVDADADGYTADGDGESDADCDDTDPGVHPDGAEVPYDGLDNDCSEGDLVDLDGDGHDAAEVGGDDCDDLAPDVNPGIEEASCDGRDDDCDGEDCPTGGGGCGHAGAAVLVLLAVGRLRGKARG